ncbi:MAG: hypothetical protein IIW23_04380 [Clostridia bacterium]|nr:hypothetical protein [Clostridia bacterium]
MTKLIIGAKGSGKTKKLIDLVLDAAEKTAGNVVCIEKGPALTFNVPHSVRLVDTDTYGIQGYDALYGLLCGVCATNYDVTDIFADATLKIGGRDMESVLTFFHRIAALSDESNINFTFTLSCDACELPEELFTIAERI